eukprot:TRINITY_DN98962_c0_g1_i1.p1 TRINITY_DN98962_c0_g1~~TRINITY_DN98962_c0_g1_i1.p1  ORF type:complete len:265 (-),score=36.52 TRINITY_DN98962_c0_g1_i1:136-870(-)
MALYQCVSNSLSPREITRSDVFELETGQVASTPREAGALELLHYPRGNFARKASKVVAIASALVGMVLLAGISMAAHVGGTIGQAADRLSTSATASSQGSEISGLALKYSVNGVEVHPAGAKPGVCNETDAKLWEEGGRHFDPLMSWCGKPCWAGALCTKDCYVRNGYTATCGLEFGNLAACSALHCLIPCTIGTKQGCDICAATNCMPTFWGRTGFQKSETPPAYNPDGSRSNPPKPNPKLVH